MSLPIVAGMSFVPSLMAIHYGQQARAAIESCRAGRAVAKYSSQAAIESIVSDKRTWGDPYEPYMKPCSRPILVRPEERDVEAGGRSSSERSAIR
jgi:hypothetical protein